MNSQHTPGIADSVLLNSRKQGLPYGPRTAHDVPPPESLWLVRDSVGADAAEVTDQRGKAKLGGLDFLSIRLVVFCADKRCLSAAARECSISLSAASHRLTNLEKALNTRLFKRDHLGLQPTQAGTVFATHARAILLTLYSAERRLTALSSAGV
ncbi:LysR family transcriptional regulator [Ramlibacter sp. RBP-2]|uniref:LysR family transcriptional regulator n=1 Tax=Ramlibacter lithotrophicus TaxID=2606681 RepID=A0A7X6DI48_9BURK|nr:LysR family transcriptional regulator [Ramlibacter lithotrophicus]NKE67604.1 LysR family transcriptional regulator [Ramlibacter lithotrophicus]